MTLLDERDSVVVRQAALSYSLLLQEGKERPGVRRSDRDYGDASLTQFTRSLTDLSQTLSGLQRTAGRNCANLEFFCLSESCLVMESRESLETKAARLSAVP